MNHAHGQTHGDDEMNTTAKKAIKAITLAELSILLAVSILMLYYAYLSEFREPGNRISDFLEVLLRRQEDVIGLLAAPLLALPSLSLKLATTDGGAVTKFGKRLIYLLLPTLLLCVIANVWLVPHMDSPGTNLAPLVDSSTLRLSSYCLTYLVAILGLSSVVGPRPKE